jgi:Flp pilus assembly pilin Flp
MRKRADRGAEIVEFGLLLAALAVGIVGAASLAGAGLQGVLTAAVAAITG